MSIDERREQARVLVVEDEGVVVLDLTRRLTALGYEVCGCADTAAEAVAVAAATKPDLVLMDIVLQGDVDGVDAAAEILKHRSIPIVFLTAHADAATIQRAKHVEPSSYLVKPFEESEMDAAIQLARYRYRTNPAAQLKSHDFWRIRGIAAEMSDRSERLRSIMDLPVEHTDAGRKGTADQNDATDPSLPHTIQLERPASLAPREWEVARALVRGQRMPDLARTLGISVHTARNHLRSVFRKLGVRSQAELMRVLLAARGGT
jgi:DNA-binding NarL/FixJ family response regulator